MPRKFNNNKVTTPVRRSRRLAGLRAKITPDSEEQYQDRQIRPPLAKLPEHIRNSPSVGKMTHSRRKKVLTRSNTQTPVMSAKTSDTEEEVQEFYQNPMAAATPVDELENVDPNPVLHRAETATTVTYSSDNIDDDPNDLLYKQPQLPQVSTTKETSEESSENISYDIEEKSHLVLNSNRREGEQILKEPEAILRFPRPSTRKRKQRLNNLDYKILLCLFFIFDLYLISFLRAANFFTSAAYPNWFKQEFDPFVTVVFTIILFWFANMYTVQWTKDFSDNYLYSDYNFGLALAIDQQNCICDERSYVLLHVVHSILTLLNVLMCFWIAFSSSNSINSVACFKSNEYLAIGFYLCQCLWSLKNLTRMDSVRNFIILAFLYIFYVCGNVMDVVFCLALKSLLSVVMSYKFRIGSEKWVWIDVGVSSATIHFAAWFSIQKMLDACKV